MTDVMQDLLIDFDEMGFAPTTVCPNPDKYACEWKEKLVSEINCLQEQLEAAANGQETLQKALAEKDREVDDLKVENQSLRTAANCYKFHYNEARSEAVREFSEAVVDGIDEGYISHSSDIVDFTADYLRGKMVGDTE